MFTYLTQQTKVHFLTSLSQYFSDVKAALNYSLPRITAIPAPTGIHSLITFPITTELLKPDPWANQGRMFDTLLSTARVIRDTAKLCSLAMANLETTRLSNYILKPADLHEYLTEQIVAQNAVLPDASATLALGLMTGTVQNVDRWNLVSALPLANSLSALLHGDITVNISQVVGSGALANETYPISKALAANEAEAAAVRSTMSRWHSHSAILIIAALLSLVLKPEQLNAILTPDMNLSTPAAVSARRKALEDLASLFHGILMLPFSLATVGMRTSYQAITAILGLEGSLTTNMDAEKVYNEFFLTTDILNVHNLAPMISDWLTEPTNTDVKGVLADVLPEDFLARGFMVRTPEGEIGYNGTSYDQIRALLTENASSAFASDSAERGFPDTSGGQMLMLTAFMRRVLQNHPISPSLYSAGVSDIIALHEIYAHNLRYLTIQATNRNRYYMTTPSAERLRGNIDITSLIPAVRRVWLAGPRVSSPQRLRENEVPLQGTFSDTFHDHVFITRHLAGRIMSARDLTQTLTSARSSIINAVTDEVRRSTAVEATGHDWPSTLPGQLTAGAAAITPDQLATPSGFESFIAQHYALTVTTLLDYLPVPVTSNAIVTFFSSFGLFSRDSGQSVVPGIGLPYGVTYADLFKHCVDPKRALEVGKGIIFYPLVRYPNPTIRITHFRLPSSKIVSVNEGDLKSLVDIFEHVVVPGMSHFALQPLTTRSEEPLVVMSSYHTYINESVVMVGRPRHATRETASAKTSVTTGTFIRQKRAWPGHKAELLLEASEVATFIRQAATPLSDGSNEADNPSTVIKKVFQAAATAAADKAKTEMKVNAQAETATESSVQKAVKEDADTQSPAAE